MKGNAYEKGTGLSKKIDIKSKHKTKKPDKVVQPKAKGEN